jgi:putative NADH-flavin reductase
MSQGIDIETMDHLIREMKRLAEEVETVGHEFPAVVRNARRIMASVRMLEINVSDVWEILKAP